MGQKMDFLELSAIAKNEAKAIKMIEGVVWPNGPVCPFCDATDRIYVLEGVKDKKGRVRPGLKKCGHCKKQFTVRKGTIFEESLIPMGKWLLAIHMMCSSKKGVSAAQLQRMLKLSYKSAHFMCHRVRLAMAQSPLAEKLGGPGTSGIVEIDETYVGGVRRNNPHKEYKAKPKPIVMTLVEREGRVRTFPIPNTRMSTMQDPVKANVEGTAHIVTDGHPSYIGLAKHFASHGYVDHGKEYVRGILHVNFAESYHSLLKRGIVGTFHHVSEKHLPMYLHEFEFRWNSRKETDETRTEKAIFGAKGKRLTYKTPLL